MVSLRRNSWSDCPGIRTDDASIQRELNIALRHHAGEGNEKGVMLCLWAGADPHASAPSLRYDVRAIGDDDEEEDDSSGVSAVWQACCSGQHEVLRRLVPDPQLDDFDSLYYVASNSATMRILMDIAPPRRSGAVICSLINDVSWRSSLTWNYYGSGHYETVRALETLFEGGIRWHVAEGEEAAAVRSTLIKLRDDPFIEIVKLLAAKDYCSSDILREIARTPAMRRRMKEVGFIPPDPDEDDRRRFRHDPPTRSKEVRSKFGVEPEPRRAASNAEQKFPRETLIGSPRPGTCRTTISRQELYERVWTTPVEALAKECGLSGRGLSKACARLHVPVPPRGYWARLSAGQQVRRPRLPTLRPGEIEVIVVWHDVPDTEQT